MLSKLSTGKSIEPFFNVHEVRTMYLFISIMYRAQRSVILLLDTVLNALAGYPDILARAFFI